MVIGSDGGERDRRRRRRRRRRRGGETYSVFFLYAAEAGIVPRTARVSLYVATKPGSGFVFRASPTMPVDCGCGRM